MDGHILILPNTGDSNDPNCYCSCKEWQVIDPRPYTTSQLTTLHLYHCIETLSNEVKVYKNEQQGRLGKKGVTYNSDSYIGVLLLALISGISGAIGYLVLHGIGLVK